MNHDDDFMKSIPLFLRRFDAPGSVRAPIPPAATDKAAPLTPVFASEDEAAPPAPVEEVPVDVATDKPIIPTGKPGTLPWMTRRKARAAAGAPLSHVPVPPPLTAEPAESVEDQPQAKNFFRDARVEIEQAFAQAPEKAQMPAPARSNDDTDAPFQVTLPRGVIRQIRLRAAEDGTTHRAIVLRALREAGLAVPEGADVDRRVHAAKVRRRA